MEFDDCESWLLPKFLVEDDFLGDAQQGFGYGVSGGSSPGDSVVSSTDSESDEDDYITCLTRRMAHSTLEEDDGNGYGGNKVWGLSGSPKSPLVRGLVGASEDASGKKMVEEFAGLFPSNNELFAPLEQPCPDFGFKSFHQLQAARFEHMKREQMLKEQRQGRGVWIQENGGCGDFYHQIKLRQELGDRVENGGRRQVGLSSSGWPTLQQSQQQPGSGMRPVFLGNHGANKERTGTGVFLPRRIGSTESRKNKSACSTVLLPNRVVQALNLNLETLDAKNQVNQRNIVSSNNAYEAALKYGKRNEYNGKQRQNRENSTRSQAVSDEVRLPPEWIY